MEISLQQVGLDIKNRRLESNLSQKQLADSCNIDRAQLSKIEKGSVKGVTYATITKIYETLGLTLIPMKEQLEIPNLHPFVKWAGGKTQLLETIEQHMPDKFNRYFEPFVGGGALLFKLQPESFSINDFSSELICAYNCFKNDDDFKLLKEELKRHESNHSEEYYYQIRNMDREEGFEELPDYVKAGRMIYLNKSCFNGLHRVNSNGYFNVPSGKKDKVKCFSEDNFDALHNFFKNRKGVITNLDFEKAVANAKAGDFVYFDPPYDVLEEKNSFTAYSKNEFGKEAQKRLAKVYKKLSDKGVYVMLSNHNTPFIQELYKDFHINVVQARRNINSKGNARGKVEEVLITNYE